ncbi:Fork head 1 [Choanephora cucurbitarum]|uniref:Fork head 1 n=1 Tax=Choanephora cucurbitarum TaxID=101091 RepID=A0A1C7NGM4_9FUNG|nr:Fork head 1 [Choanephora cucurbitarum]
MNKWLNFIFNDDELSNGFHLLTESSDTVKVNTPPVPASDIHLYPRLAGSNWTSYLSIPCIVLGRSTTVNPSASKRRQATVDVDFGSSKAISRRHCEIRFSMRRDRWEIYVYGRNGIRINHAVKKPHDKPAVLKTGDLIEINQTSFVFILPNSFIKPRYPSQIESGESEVNTPHDGDSNVDHKLEADVMQLLEQNVCLNTMEIVDKLKSSLGHKDANRDSILQLLVLSSKFHLAPTSVAMTSKESDAAKWVLMPSSSKPDLSKDLPLPTIHESPEDKAKATTDKEEERKNASLRKLFEYEDDDWSVFMPNSPPPEDSTTKLSDHNKDEEDDIPPTSPSIPPPPPPAAASSSPSIPPPLPPTSPSSSVKSSVPFRSLSIESIYTIWNTLSQHDDEDNNMDEIRPEKRFKPSHSYQTTDQEVDIYKEVRTKIV